MAKPLRTTEPSPVVEITKVEPQANVQTESMINRKPVNQAYRVLQLGFTAAPIIAGTDKFFHMLVDWDQYLAPVVPRTLGIDGHTFMLGAGAVEIVAGIGVALKPKIFGYIVSGWLLGIVGNLLLTGKYYDIALRDFGLALGAFALGRLSHVFERGKVGQRQLKSV